MCDHQGCHPRQDLNVSGDDEWEFIQTKLSDDHFQNSPIDMSYRQSQQIYLH